MTSANYSRKIAGTPIIAGNQLTFWLRNMSIRETAEEDGVFSRAFIADVISAKEGGSFQKFLLQDYA